MFRLNLKIALRNLWKNKGLTFINVGGLAIGLTCCLIILLYIRYEYGFDKGFRYADRTYIAYTNMKANGKTFSWAWTPAVLAPALKDKVSEVSQVSRATYPSSQLISYEATKIKNKALFAEPAFLKIFGFKFISGNENKALQEINTVILTKSLAKKLFGEESAINKSVKLDNTNVLKVEAVIEDLPPNTSIKFDYIMPWKLFEVREPWVKDRGWGSNFCMTVVQLQHSDLLNKVNADIKNTYRQNGNESNTNELFLHPLEKWHLYGEFENGKSVGGKIDQLKILFMLSFCILLIACVNFMNLSTARSEKRAREVGIRKAIGSSRAALVYQFILESVLTSFLAMLLAFVLIEVSLPYFNNLLNIELIINYNVWQYWAVIVGLMLFTGFIAGSYPAFYLSSFEPVKVLKGSKVNVGAAFSVRKMLVVFQFVFAASLIVFIVVIYQQINFVKNKPIGYSNDHLIQLSAQGLLQDAKKVALLKEQLLKSGAVQSVSTFSMDLTSGGNNTSDISWEGKDITSKVLFNERGIGYDFVETAGVELLDGRTFSVKFPNDTSSIILNEASVKVMGLKDPIGKRINWGESQLTVIGVMKDFVVESPYKKVDPTVFYSSEKNAVGTILIRLKPSQQLSSSLAQIDAVISRINPDYPIDRSFVNQSFEDKFQNEKLLGTLSNWFGGFAIFISCLGLLGLALFMAEQRKKEISIRKVLGASTSNILTLLNKDFIKLVGMANLIAFPLSYILVNMWLSSFEYRVAISVLPFVLAIGISLLIAILTISIQSVKVAKANPIDALKYE